MLALEFILIQTMPLPCNLPMALSLTGSAKHFIILFECMVWTFIVRLFCNITLKANYTSSNTFERSKTCREALASASLNTRLYCRASYEN